MVLKVLSFLLACFFCFRFGLSFQKIRKRSVNVQKVSERYMSYDTDNDSSVPIISRFDDNFNVEDVYKSISVEKIVKQNSEREKKRFSPEQMAKKKAIQNQKSSDKAYEAYWKKQNDFESKALFGRKKIKGTSDDPVLRAYYNLKGEETIREKANPKAAQKDFEEWDYNLNDSGPKVSIKAGASMLSLVVLLWAVKHLVL